MKPFFIFCALCCFIGIFRLPIEYYTFLRVLVSIGALLAIYLFLSSGNKYFSIIFLVILIIFNPVFPIYLYRKSIWIPIDTLTGILFMLIAFVERPVLQKEEDITEETPIYTKQLSAPSRDRIINPKQPKEQPANHG